VIRICQEQGFVDKKQYVNWNSGAYQVSDACEHKQHHAEQWAMSHRVTSRVTRR